MKALRIDFARNGATPVQRLGRALLALSLMAFLVAGWHALRLRQQLETWQGAARHLERQDAASHRPPSAEDQTRIKLELGFATRVIGKLDLPWEVLFEAVERATTDQVTLLGIEPDAETRGVKLSAEAKDFTAMLAYLKQVRASGVLRNAYVADHQINQQDPQRPVRFAILAEWTDRATAVPEASTASVGARTIALVTRP